MRFTKIILTIICFALASNNCFSQAADTLVKFRTEGVVDYNQPTKYLLKDIKVTGVESVNVNLLLGSIGLVKGDSLFIPSEQLSNSIKKLWQFKMYSDVKVLYQFDKQDAYLEIALKGRPFVADWDISGVKVSEKRDLLETLKLTRNIQFSEYLIQSSTKAIKNFFIEKGFLHTEVTSNIVKDSLKFRDREYVRVSFNVNKGSKVKIKEITFDGLEGFKDKKVASYMKNNNAPTLFNFFKSKKFKPNSLTDDKLLIEEFLQSQGFRNATIVSDSIYKLEDGKVGINFKVNQGNKYYYGDITWTGNEKYPTDYLDGILKVNKGDVYDNKTLKTRLGLNAEGVQKGIANVRGLYQDDGYLTSDVAAIEDEVASDTVDINIRILEGNQFSINKVTIAGNTRTHDKVVRRDLYILPGELYSQSMLISSVQRLGALGNFSQESTFPNIIPVAGSDDLVDISFNLEEASTDNVSFSGGFGAGTFVLGIGITFKNLSLKKMFTKGAWRPYPAGDNQVFNLTVQTNGSYYKNISFNFVEPWLGGNKPNSLGVSFYYSSQTNGYSILDKGSSQFSTMGASATFGTRLSWPDPYFTFSGGITYQHYNMNNWPNFVVKTGISHILALNASLSRNSLNSPRYPSSGSEFAIKVQATPPYSLLKSDKDYYNNPALPDTERYKLIEYYKFDLKAKVYENLMGNDKLVFHAAANFGYLGHYNPNAISPFEGFSVGGSGLGGYNLYGITYVGLRGYADGVLTPGADYGEQARVYSKYTMELRYPFVNTPGTTLFMLAFAEAGNAYNSWREFKPFELKKSVGLGLRIFLPVVGMMGIDVGYGFDRAPYESERSGFQFHFTMGQQF